MKKRLFALVLALLVTAALSAAGSPQGAAAGCGTGFRASPLPAAERAGGAGRGSSFWPTLLPAQPLAAGSVRNGAVRRMAGGDIAIAIDPDYDDADTILFMLTFGVGAAALASMLLFMASR